MTDLSASTQKEIIEDFKTNKEAFARVYNFYFDPIFHFLLKRTMSAELAYDINAETFLRAFKTFHRFQWKGISIKVWLFRIALNLLKNHYRQEHVVFYDDFTKFETQNGMNMRVELEELNQTLFMDEELQRLHAGLKQLNRNYQEIIGLYYFGGLSQTKIANTLGRSPSAIKALLHRAVTQLRATVKNSLSHFS